MKKILPILVLFLASSCSDVGRYQAVVKGNFVGSDGSSVSDTIYILDTATGLLYKSRVTNKKLEG